MKTLYLASRSKARLQILKSIGIRAIVIPSTVREQRRRGKLTYSQLAIRNAQMKAQDVCRKLKSGIVLAADTFVVQDDRMFGKPRTLIEARRMLQRLSRKPHELYTGLAVVDVSTGHMLIACERTKIYMDPLTDAEIKHYFSQVDPRAHAGSFDIQGKGACFVRRIEGCYYNVVGLPIRTCMRLLKKCTDS